MICDRIRKIRTDAGESQARMGERLGVAQRTIAGWESGNRQPSLEMLIKIAEAYHVTSDYLLGLGDLPNMYAQPDMVIGNDTWEIYSESKDLSPKDREQVAHHIQSAMEDETSLTLQSSSQFDLERIVRKIVEQIRQEERDKQNDDHQ